jgi:Lrp/AsnC family transcriptional regulator
MHQSLDKTDLELLRKLQQDASQPVAALAEQLHLSKSACWRRLQRLERDGVIQRTVAVLNPEKLGLNLTVFIRVRTREHNASWSQQFRDNVERIDGVTDVYRMGGDIDYLIKAVVEDMPAYDRLYQQLIAVDLFDVTASFVMEAIKQRTALPI